MFGLNNVSNSISNYMLKSFITSIYHSLLSISLLFLIVIGIVLILIGGIAKVAFIIIGAILIILAIILFLTGGAL